MKLRKSSKAAAAIKNAEVAKDRSANTATTPTKEKKKRFSLFKSKKNKKGPKTPDTVGSGNDYELTGGKNLLSDLELANTSVDAEGMELILPSPKYEVKEEETEKVEPKIETNEEAPKTEEKPEERPEEKPEEEKPAEEPATTEVEESFETNESGETNDSSELNTSGDTDDTDLNDTGETDDILNETGETNDTLNRTDTTEEEKKEDEELIRTASVVEATQKSFNKATDSALKYLANALKCSGIDPEQSCDSYGAAIYENPFLGKNVVDLDNLLDEKSAADFLHDMTNVGFTLVYHKAVDEESWAGRTVNMIFRPGVCSSEKLDQPVVEWSTMEGGKSDFVETKTLELLSIDAVGTSSEGIKTEASSLPIPAKPPTNDQNTEVSVSMCNLSFTPGDDDGIDCFFTITSQNGEVHLFEALNLDECHRIVAGIRFSAQRLSQIVIEGNSNVIMSDFYDDSREPVQAKLTQTEVLNKLSNAFLDGQ
eukprot:CAMPEP_0116134280 /NCGR_PEP_ID=MMETSP0329-20121206/10561_1 /TAXON_ID=697910 /ORGANISM="Pseudo-nitzschia arenysensis, Strain B593" /LENGTH=482 /DNA_ID=CAMNT_0003628979 /DNA_START=103 /DNA_END=1551 /DNA_ORIENTATION=-